MMEILMELVNWAGWFALGLGLFWGIVALGGRIPGKHNERQG